MSYLSPLKVCTNCKNITADFMTAVKVCRPCGIRAASNVEAAIVVFAGAFMAIVCIASALFGSAQ